MKEIIVRRYEVDENKISYLPSGISVEKAAGADARSPLPSDVLPSDRRILFTASRLSVEKNVDMIIKAASILLRPKKDVVFLIAGTGPMMFELKKLASTLGVSNKVIFLGFVDNRTVLAIMRKCYAVINPTNLPGASKLTMEAFANKKPVVRANALDTHPVIDFTSGLLYNPEDPNDLAEKLDILLTDECFAKKLGKRGYRIVKDEYDLSKVAKGYIRIYDELIN
jgi:glycosyltransferase involved in cell wall biosynthesis